MNPEQVMELQPTWTERTDTSLVGTVTIYPEYTGPDGAQYQFPTEMHIYFYRMGTTADKCTGALLMTAVDAPGDATAKFAMIHGHTGRKLELRASGFDTEACDAIFQDAGGLSWGEVWNKT